MKDRIESLIGGLENCIENAKLRGDAYDVGYMSAMVTEARALLADGGKGEAVSFQSPLDGRWITVPQAECAPLCEHEWQPMTKPHKECVKCGDVRLAECAPREAARLSRMQRIAIEAAMSISRDIENESHDGSFLNNESMQALHELLAAPTPERADAGKDAARWKWLKTQSTVGEQWGIMKTPWSRWDAYADAAILAANKEPK